MIRNDNCLADVHARNVPGHSESVRHVLRFMVVRGPPRQHARIRHQRLQEQRRIHQANPFVLQHAGDSTDQRIRIFARQREKQLRQFPIRPDGAENFVVLHLAGHDRLLHAFLMHQVNRLAQLAEAHPMQPLGDFFQLLRRLFLQRDHRHVDSLTARPFQHEEGKAPISRDESPACRVCVGVRHEISV